MKVVKKGDKYKHNTVTYKKPKQMSFESFLKDVTKKTKGFFRQTYADIKKNASKIIKKIRKEFQGSKNSGNFLPGTMINFQYKAKDVTKRYDKVPLCIMLGPPKNPKLSNTHTYGINLHWLPLKERVGIATFLLELKQRNGGELTYDDVKPFLHKFKNSPVLRMYIIKNISSKVYEIDTEMFITAAALPSEKWAGG